VRNTIALFATRPNTQRLDKRDELDVSLNVGRELDNIGSQA